MGDLEWGGRYDNSKGRRGGRRYRRARGIFGKFATPLLLLASFLLPFSFLLVAERGKRLPHGAVAYDISRPGQIKAEGDVVRMPVPVVEEHAQSSNPPREGGRRRPPPKSSSAAKGKATRPSKSTAGEPRVGSSCKGGGPCPLISRLSVSSGPVAGGTKVTIEGKNFGLPTSLQSILIGDTPCMAYESVSDEQVTCTVPPGTGYSLAVTVRTADAEGSSDPSACGWSYDKPLIESIEPTHASRRGGAQITVKGANFGVFDSHPIAYVGGEACLDTKWVSNEQVVCTVPPGEGNGLRVSVTACGCGDLYKKNQTGSGGRDREASFSYDEDIMKDNSGGIMEGIDLKKLRRVSLTLNAELVNLKYEAALPNVVTGENVYFAVVPEILPVLPPKDVRNRYETCAIVGSSGSLLDGRYGDAIDEHDAVFRLHNAPTQTFEGIVGSKTTYQVLSPFWAGELLKVGETGKNWVHEGANLVLWSMYSQEQYLELKEKLPTVPVTLLNTQFTASIISAAKVMQERIERVMGTEFDLTEGYSSVLMSVALAMETCGKVDLYGVDMRYGKYLYYESHEVATSTREASSLEYMIFLVLKAHGHIASINEGSSRGSAQLASKPASCAYKECKTDCNDRGIFVNGTCHCDPIYAGPDCGVSRLEQEATKILSGLNLTYGGSLVINRKEVNGTKIQLPEGITRNKFGKSGDVYNVDRMLYHVIPEEDTKIRYSTCAIVGNSGSMLKHDYGHEIDAHEMVYRFNQAPVKGYEKHVGSRSTHESLNGYWVKQVLDERRGFKWNWRSRDTETVVFELFEPGAYGWKAKSQIIEKDQWWRQSYVRLKQQHQGRKITALSPHFVSWSYQMYRDLRRRFQRAKLGRYPGEKPMSGFYAFFFALQVCDEVDIYGFAPWRDLSDKHLPKDSVIVSKDRYHYFDSARPRPGSHSFDLALYIYRLFAIHYDNVRVYE